MNSSYPLKVVALMSLALAMFPGDVSYGQNWTVTGKTAGGGNIIVGTAPITTTLDATNPTPTTLTATGFDNITLNMGVTAGPFALAAPINIPYSNETFTNNGTVIGGIIAVNFGSGGSLSNATVTNNGSIIGGNGTGIGGGTGIAFDPGSGAMTGITLTNFGNITGGSDTGGGGGGFGIAFNPSGGGVSGVTLTNFGSVTGGSDTGGGFGSAGILFNSPGAVSNVILTNFGVITGGTGNGGGSGIRIVPGGSVSNVKFINYGSVTGGNDTGGSNAGSALRISPAGDVSNVTVINFGSLTGGNDINGNPGNGIAITPNGAINNLILTNNGSVTGGSDTGGSGGSSAIDIFSNVAVSNMVLTNNGSLTGGNSNGGGGFMGIHIEPNSAVKNLLLINNAGGTFTGGNDSAGGAGGNGIDFTPGAPGSSNLTIMNFGRITGGNSAAGSAGIGIRYTSDNLTINNWGNISAGNGVSTAALPGFPAVAVSVSGNNNTINLNGHSSVNGTLEGAGVHNVLNLNFTGLSPVAIAALKAQLAAQGWPATNDFTGAFTVRGVTYFVDPLILNLNVSSYQQQGITPNQGAIGASLDSITFNPAPGSPLFNFFNAIDQSGNVPGALEALSPQKYQVYGDLAIENSTAIVQNVDARLNNMRDGSESIDTTGVGGTSDRTTSGFSKNDGKESKEVVQPAAPEKKWGFFATGEGLFFRGSSHDVDLQQARASSAGTLAGVDAKIGEHFVAGALFAYNNTDAKLGNDGSKATIESYSGGIYGAFHQDGFYVNGLAAYTSNHYTSQRNIAFPGFASTATGGAHGNQYTGNLDGGYDFHVTDRVTVGPLVGVQYVHLDVNSFNETGAGAAGLAIGDQDMDSLQSRVGGRADYHLLTTEHSSFAAEVHAAWQHEYLNDSRGISASFAGTGLAPFSIQTSAPRRDSGVVGLGVNFTFKDTLTLFVDYELQMWSASSFQQSVNGGGRISW